MILTIKSILKDRLILLSSLISWNLNIRLKEKMILRILLTVFLTHINTYKNTFKNCFIKAMNRLQSDHYVHLSLEMISTYLQSPIRKHHQENSKMNRKWGYFSQQESIQEKQSQASLLKGLLTSYLGKASIKPIIKSNLFQPSLR